jgi:ferric-dicitrate binding protein FerR (iron transport regulator)
MVRANGGASTVLKLADGSREMRADSELFIERADDGVRLHLNQGTVIVNAAKQRNGHLYVHARDITVSVGAVFFVKTEEAGSRVGVLEGLVVVSHEEISRKLGAGEEFSSPRCFEYHSRI